MDVLKKHLFYVSFAVPMENMRMYFFHFSLLYTEEEKKKKKEMIRELKVLKTKYHLKNAFGPEILIMHHGLAFQPKGVLSFLRDKIFLDIGAFTGDSSSVLFQYSPSKIIAFEPDPQNCKDYVSAMRENGIDQSKYELLPFFVAGHDDEKTLSLDSFFLRKNYGPIGFLKADVEGAGLDLIKGAERIIREHRPVISIAIYHNTDEFSGIYPLLKAWDLHYVFQVKSLGYPVMLTETTLLAIPEELLEK